MAGPRWISSTGAVVVFGKRTRKPNSVYAVIPLGAALPRTLISDLPGGFGNCSSRLAASGRCAAGAWLLAPRFPPYLVLLRVGFTLPPPLLPERCALTAPFHPYHWRRQLGQSSGSQDALPKAAAARRYVFCGTGRPRALTPASRTLSGTLPCGVRTFLSRQPRLAQGLPAATARSSCQPLVYREIGLPVAVGDLRGRYFHVTIATSSQKPL